ncbi:PD-(D/E)XK nuclease family protein [Methylocella tundrae]|nr:PD-(D/E)XK nuclease family protein [Methylocella tundrae]
MRRTIVVHTRLSGHMARVAAARRGEHGVQILTMSQLASRLAGGFLQPIDPDALQDAVRKALSAGSLGDLDAIKTLPGMVRAVVDTLDKIWRAGIDLSTSSEPRLRALRMLEVETLRRLPASMKRPAGLVELACARIGHAPAVIGPVEIRGHSEMSPCWRPLLSALTNAVPVVWVAEARSVPSWLTETAVEIRREAPPAPTVALFSCATPQHEALEAVRWMRELIASGKARPEDIAIAVASPADFDDHIMALSADANIPIHFVHGLRAVTTRDGQTVAALAETLLKGVSQERIGRLFKLLPEATPALTGLPSDWARVLPKDAPLTTVQRWRQAFDQVAPEDWPEGIDRSNLVMDVLQLIERGPEEAADTGERLLSGKALALWKKALADGPAAALTVTLAQLRIPDGLEPAANVIWTSAISLASATRPFVRLLALNSGRWPRRISEDRLIPDHIIPIEELDPLPVADGDRRDFLTILSSAHSAAMSFSRRDVGGRLLGKSPLINGFAEIYLSRGRTPEHAASESDRLLARPGEFRQTPIAISGAACWDDWSRPEITAHDGLVGPGRPRLQNVFKGPLSATSLKLLLRDPIRFVWRYALGWKQPDVAEEPLNLDALAFGILIHSILQEAVQSLEASGGFGRASQAKMKQAVDEAIASVKLAWEREQPTPPPVIWGAALDRAKDLSVKALGYRLPPLHGQKSWTEIPFGRPDGPPQADMPWDPTRGVEIPGTGVFIQGNIDRLDLAADCSAARVIDYKTGKLHDDMADVAIRGGDELQRCLYAFAVKTLIGPDIKVDAALLYPRAAEDKQPLCPLSDVDGALSQLAAAIGLARANIEAGLALPGIAAADAYNDFVFALPAGAAYLPRKSALAAEKLGQATKIWEAL